MIWFDLPSLSSLRAFSAVADMGSYSKAGARLNVTQAAVSQQVKSLERRLGVSLVTRAGRGIALTPEGARLARDINTGFAAIRSGVEALTVSEETRPLQVTMSPAFATEWLMPRLPEFQLSHPDITLMLNPTADVMPLDPGGIDLAIRYKDRNTMGDGTAPFMICDTVVIGAPSLIGGKVKGDLAALAELPWLQELGTNNVADWFERRGIALDQPLMITDMPGNLIMQGVRRGDGLTHTIRAFFEDDIRAGRIIEVFREEAFGVFYIDVAPGVVRPQVKTFVHWLMAQSRAHPTPVSQS